MTHPLPRTDRHVDWADQPLPTCLETTSMKTSDIHTEILALPELATWPEVGGLLPADDRPLRTDWMLPVYACRAVGGEQDAMLHIVTAIACLQISIILVDDILDDDPRGAHLEMGSGRAANLALALQAAATTFVDRSGLEVARRAAVNSSLQRMALATAAGQEIDVQQLVGEENYWRLVQAKSTPFYAAAFEVGGIVGQAPAAVTRDLYAFGALFGEIIQILDDLMDAFEVPPKPDWGRIWNNLAILYAASADHPQREQFRRLLPAVAEPQKLEAAQQILMESGAVSYCVYQLVERDKAVHRLLAAMPLAEPALLLELCRQEREPVVDLLAHIGLELPLALWKDA